MIDDWTMWIMIMDSQNREVCRIPFHHGDDPNIAIEEAFRLMHSGDMCELLEELASKGIEPERINNLLQQARYP